MVDNLRTATGDLSNAVDFTVHFKLGTPIERVRADRQGRARAGRRRIRHRDDCRRRRWRSSSRPRASAMRCARSRTIRCRITSWYGRRRTPAVPPRWSRCGAISRHFPRSRSCSSTSTGCAACIRCSTCSRRVHVGGGARARTRRARGDRQHHPPGDPAAPAGDRGHQAGGRLECVRAPAVPVHRPFLRARGRAAGGPDLSRRASPTWTRRSGSCRPSTAASFHWRAWAAAGLGSSGGWVRSSAGWGRSFPPAGTSAGSSPAPEPIRFYRSITYRSAPSFEGWN